MARVLTFSRVYPSYHPKAGQPTYFVEKIWRSLIDQGLIKGHPRWDNEIENYNWNYAHFDDCKAFIPKEHTIRAGHRWKVGDWFSPRVWAGAPYRSKQIAIGPDMQIKKLWDFGIIISGRDGELATNFYVKPPHETKRRIIMDLTDVAANDGLSVDDFKTWFLPRGTKFIVNYPVFDGQIICWNENIDY